MLLPAITEGKEFDRVPPYTDCATVRITFGLRFIFHAFSPRDRMNDSYSYLPERTGSPEGVDESDATLDLTVLSEMKNDRGQRGRDPCQSRLLLLQNA